MGRSLCALALVFVAATSPALGGKNQKKSGGDSSPGRSILWQEPNDIESRDLFYGPGGREGAPDPNGKYQFVRRSKSGTSEKIIVEDEKGRRWTVKFGPEARPETSASRIVWAAGYHVDQAYFVARVHIRGRGGFEARNVRFERRNDGLKEEGIWPWDANPFMGSRELDGLKTLMVLLNNWDLKDENNKIAQVDKKGSDESGLRLYYVSDLGATLGSTGSFFTKLPFLGNAAAGTKGDPESYANQAFIDGVQNGKVVFHYKGKNPSVVEGVPVQSARWMGILLARLSDKQLSDAFRAGGFSDSEVTMYTRAFRSKVRQLQNLK